MEEKNIIYNHFEIKGKLNISNLLKEYKRNVGAGVIQSQCAGYLIMPTPIFANQDTFFEYKGNKIKPLFYNKYERFLLEDSIFQNEGASLEDKTQFLLLFENRISSQVWLKEGNGASAFVFSKLNTNSPILSIPQRTSEAYAKEAIIEAIHKKIVPYDEEIIVPQLKIVN